MNDVSPRLSAPRPVRRGQARSRGLIVFLRTHRAFARIGIYTQLLAFVLVPGLHTVGHRADHDHGTNGHIQAHALGTEHGHSRPGAAAAGHDLVAIVDVLAGRAHSTLPGGAIDAPGGVPGDAPAPGHGHGSAAHFGAALTASTSYCFVPLVAPAELLLPPALRSFESGSSATRLPPARAPPTV